MQSTTQKRKGDDMTYLVFKHGYDNIQVDFINGEMIIRRIRIDGLVKVFTLKFTPEKNNVSARITVDPTLIGSIIDEYDKLLQEAFEAGKKFGEDQIRKQFGNALIFIADTLRERFVGGIEKEPVLENSMRDLKDENS